MAAETNPGSMPGRAARSQAGVAVAAPAPVLFAAGVVTGTPRMDHCPDANQPPVSSG